MKNILTNTAIILCIVLSVFTKLSAQLVNGTIPPGSAIFDSQIDGDTDPDDFFNCYSTALLKVYVTNLIPDPERDDYFILPPSADPLFLRYVISGQSGIVPVESFKYDQEHPSGLPLYYANIPVLFDTEAACQSSNPEVYFELELVTPNGTPNGAPYQFFSNDSVDDIFSCAVFCASCWEGFGPVDEAGCVLPQYSEIASGFVPVGSCANCPEADTGNDDGGDVIDVDRIPVEDSETTPDIPERPRTGGNLIDNNSPLQLQVEIGSVQNNDLSGNIESGQNTDTPIIIIKDVEINPNPFRTNANILFYGNQKEQAEIIILDISGNQILQQIITTNKGINKIELSTDSWTSGIYYGYIRSKSNAQTFRMMKVN